MSKIFVHAKTMIDGVSDTPKFDQLITCEDGKITAIEPYHTINEDVVEANVVTPGFLIVTFILWNLLVLERIKNFLY